MSLTEFSQVFLALAVALIAAGMAYMLIARARKPAPVVGSFSLEDTISGIKRELQRLENTPGPTLGLLLTEVKVVLFVQRQETSSSEFGLTLPVFDETKFGVDDTATGQVGSKVTVALVPPRGSQVLSVDNAGSIQFAELLMSAREALHRSLANEPRLEAKSIEVDLAFVLTAESSDSASVKVKVVSVGLSADSKSTSSNSITLTYLNPKYQKKDAAVVTPP